MHYSPSSVLLLCVYTRYNLFAHSSYTSLLILLFIKSTVYCIAHCALYFFFLFVFFILYLYLYIYSCLVLHILHCPLSGPDLTYISLLIISCITEYVMNKKKLEPWTLNLPFGLELSPRTFTNDLVHLRLQGICIMNYIDDWVILAQSHQLAVRHRDVLLAHMKELGLRLNAIKSVHSPLQRTTFLGVVWDSTAMQACLSPARIESILSAVKSISLGQSLTVKQFQRLLGLMAAASNVIPFGLLYMRPLQWWLRTKGFSPRGNPFRMIKVMRRCFRVLVMWKKPWFLSQGPVLGGSCQRRMLRTDASLTGWGAIL